MLRGKVKSSCSTHSPTFLSAQRWSFRKPSSAFRVGATPQGCFVISIEPSGEAQYFKNSQALSGSFDGPYFEITKARAYPELKGYFLNFGNGIHFHLTSG